MNSVPALYGALERWFPSLSSRAAALGVSRDTLTRWERTPTTLVSERNARLVRQLAVLARQVEEQVSDSRGAGKWLLAPQPALLGKRPVDSLREGDLETVRRLFQPFASGQQFERITRDGYTTAITTAERTQPKLRNARDRARAADKAAVLRRIGETEERIGPVAGGGAPIDGPA
jgi:Protein of unknown function (DUF2384)